MNHSIPSPICAPKFSFVKGDLTVTYRDGSHQNVTMKFENVFSFRWDESECEPERPPTGVRRIFQSPWLTELKAHHHEGPWAYEPQPESHLQHIRLNFSQFGILDIACHDI